MPTPTITSLTPATGPTGGLTLMELLVQMEHFNGELPLETASALAEAAADQRCHVGLHVHAIAVKSL